MYSTGYKSSIPGYMVTQHCYTNNIQASRQQGQQGQLHLLTIQLQLPLIDGRLKRTIEVPTDLPNYPNNRIMRSEAEFKEFEPPLKFETRLKYGWFNLNLYSMFQDLRRRPIETGFWRI